MQAIKDSVYRSIIKICEMEKGSEGFAKIGVLVSGGVDSMVLLKLVSDMSVGMPVTVKALHVSFTDFDSHKQATSGVEEMCEDCVVELIKMPSNIIKGESSIKLEARLEMKELCYVSGCDYVFTGHHKDDQIETILFRLLRGTGLDGLGGMSRMSNYRHKDVNFFLCKPFLDFNKEQIYQYANQLSVKYVEDESNKVNDTDRNYLRNVVLPVISHRFNVDQLMTSVSNIKETSTLNEINNLEIYSGSWDINEFFKLSIGNKLFVIKECLRRNHGFNINRGMYKQLTQVFKGDMSKLKLSLGRGLVLIKNKNNLEIVSLETE